jgi:hypothetical protein
MTFRIVLLAVFCLLSQHAMLAQDVQVRADVDAKEFLIGEWIPLRLHVQAPVDAELMFPEKDEDIEGADFVSLDEASVDTGDLTQRIRRDLTVIVFDTGNVALTVLLRYRLPDDTTTYIARSNTLTLAIGGVALDTSITFVDIKEVMHVSLTIWDYLLIIGIIAIALLLAWYLYRKWKNRPLHETVVEQPPAPEIPPHVEALASLDRLQRDAPWLHGEHKAAQSRLSEIIRWYIERRYSFPALEQTTGEIMHDIARLGAARGLLGELDATLRRADLAKFARYEPSTIEHEQGVAFGVNFVESTKELPTVSEQSRQTEAAAVTTSGEEA